MRPRERRLVSDLEQMQTAADAGAMTFRTEGSPPETYDVMFNGPGLVVQDDVLAIRHVHRCTLYLHRDYPRRPPVVTWLTPVFHPNLLGPDRNGGVCIGSWSAAESLADLCHRLRELVTYRAVNPHDALDLDAASWVLEHGVEPGDALEPLAGMRVRDAVAVERIGPAA